MKTIWTPIDRKDFVQKVEEYRTSLERFRLNERSVILYLIHQSTAMEGSTLTQMEAQNLLDHAIKPGNDSKSEFMVENYADGLYQVLHWSREQKSLSWDRLKTLNHLVMRQNGVVEQLQTGQVIEPSKGHSIPLFHHIL